MFDPNDISLDSITKMFEFERQARLIDDIDDVEQLRTMLKASFKLFLKQQEVVSKLGFEGV